MATDAGFIAYVLEQAGFGHRLTTRRMFGEYALYLDGKVVAFACDNSLLLKPTEAGRAALPTVTFGRPYPEAKDYYVLDEFLDDTPLLQRLLQATADALPAPAPKASRPRKAARGASAAPGLQGSAKAKGRARKPATKTAPAASRPADAPVRGKAVRDRATRGVPERGVDTAAHKASGQAATPQPARRGGRRPGSSRG